MGKFLVQRPAGLRTTKSQFKSKNPKIWCNPLKAAKQKEFFLTSGRVRLLCIHTFSWFHEVHHYGKSHLLCSVHWVKCWPHPKTNKNERNHVLSVSYPVTKLSHKINPQGILTYFFLAMRTSWGFQIACHWCAQCSIQQHGKDQISETEIQLLDNDIKYQSTLT